MLQAPLGIASPTVQATKGSCLCAHGRVQVDTHVQGISPGNALELVAPYDVVIDASDNPPTRYLIRWATHSVHVPGPFQSFHTMSPMWLGAQKGMDAPCA